MATGARQDTIRWDRDWHGLQGWREQHNGTFRGNRHGWHLGEEEEEQEEESGIILLTEGRRSEREAHSGGYTRACCCIWLLALAFGVGEPEEEEKCGGWLGQDPFPFHCLSGW